MHPNEYDNSNSVYLWELPISLNLFFSKNDRKTRVEQVRDEMKTWYYVVSKT